MKWRLIPQNPVGLEHPSDLHRLGDREACMCLDNEINGVTNSLANHRHASLSRRQVAHADLAIRGTERIELETCVTVSMNNFGRLIPPTSRRIHMRVPAVCIHSKSIVQSPAKKRRTRNAKRLAYNIKACG